LWTSHGQPPASESHTSLHVCLFAFLPASQPASLLASLLACLPASLVVGCWGLLDCLLAVYLCMLACQPASRPADWLRNLLPRCLSTWPPGTTCASWNLSPFYPLCLPRMCIVPPRVPILAWEDDPEGDEGEGGADGPEGEEEGRGWDDGTQQDYVAEQEELLSLSGGSLGACLVCLVLFSLACRHHSL
jgi:hypothetical protein